jgi:hypothetical protein
MSHSSTTNNALQMSDLSNRQEFEKSQRDMARMQQFGKVMESKAISDGQRNKYTSKLKELRTFFTCAVRCERSSRDRRGRRAQRALQMLNKKKREGEG